MQHEMDSLEKNHTWDLVPRPTRKNVVKCRWVYQSKFTSNGVAEHHKAHLAMKGFYQQEMINYTNTFAPISKMNFVQLIVSLVAPFKWEIHQMDVKSVFLHGNLSEEIYMDQPPSFMKYYSLVC